MPNEDHAGVFSAILAYLRAVKKAGSVEGSRVVQEMRSAPIEDPLFDHVTLRPEGRAVHDIYRYEVKAPSESHGAYDDYKLLATIPGDQAFRPAAAGGCSLSATK